MPYSLRQPPQEVTLASPLSFQVIMGSSVDQIAAVVGGDLAGKVTSESVIELLGHTTVLSFLLQ